MTQCPVCYVPLRLVVVSGVDIDVCDICHGIWLDVAERDKLGGVLQSAKRKFDAAELSHFKCPRCATRTFGMIENDHGGVAVCRNCQGAFIGGQTIEEIAALGREPESTSKTEEAIFETPNLLLSLGDRAWWLGMR